MTMRNTFLVGTIITLVGMSFYEATFAQGAETTRLILAPHCADENRAACLSFTVLDAESMTTGRLAAGDILDIDVVLQSVTPQSIESVRAWLSFDETVLEARSVELTKAFAAPTPGEQNIDSVMHLVKIGGALGGTLTEKDAVIARVTFRVLSATKNTVIAFHDFQMSGTGHTYVNGKPNTAETGEIPCFDKLIGCKEGVHPLLTSEPSKLAVSLTEPGSTSSTTTTQGTTQQAQSSSSNQSSSAPAAASDERSSFSLLQVQNLRVTTKDRDIFLGWQALKSSALKGYNVYYGTVSGRYIQRKSIPANSTSLVLRDLEPGTTYFLSVKALSTTDIESAFSQEVSVVVSKPETSTAPLENPMMVDEPGTDGNPIEKYNGSTISGETGVGSSILLFLLISAIIGTAFSAHRQILLRRTHAS